MHRTCLKCGFENNNAEVGYTEACPNCGAIYFKVESAQRDAARQALQDRESAERDRSGLVKMLAGGGVIVSIVLVVVILMVIFAIGQGIQHFMSLQGGHA